MRLVALCFLLLTGCVAAPHGVPNLRCIDSTNNVWVGGQPKDGSAWTYVRSLGITNVVKFNPESSDVLSCLPIHEFPINWIQQEFGPVAPQLQAGLAATTPNTFGHCEHGMNRSGTWAILYQMRHGIPAAQAIANAEKFGWNSSGKALKDYIYAQ